MLEANAFEESVIKMFIGTTSARYIEVKERSTGQEDSDDPIAKSLDAAHLKENTTAQKGKFSNELRTV